MDFSISKAIELVKPLDPIAMPDGMNPLSPGTNDFKNLFSGLIGNVKSAQAESSNQVAAWMNGEDVDVHQVAMSVQKAGLTFEIAMEARNKVMQAYQEVMRMQI
ncbi:flagellar hook-basal body complex protein FliE [Bryobacter aggregatus]|uniref:flagellar hook-basal body complex protein FliE n=1 Tax=Bryobacter aggregatus TaxID=360054 RepID=UPI00068E8CD8|nr:flagellar hook-basal body complex protein FliE [Bryobacter aggregatus]